MTQCYQAFLVWETWDKGHRWVQMSENENPGLVLWAHTASQVDHTLCFPFWHSIISFSTAQAFHRDRPKERSNPTILGWANLSVIGLGLFVFGLGVGIFGLGLCVFRLGLGVYGLDLFVIGWVWVSMGWANPCCLWVVLGINSSMDPRRPSASYHTVCDWLMRNADGCWAPLVVLAYQFVASTQIIIFTFMSCNTKIGVWARIIPVQQRKMTPSMPKPPVSEYTRVVTV